MADISEAVRVKVASSMHQAPILDLVTTDEGSYSEEDPIPDPKRKTLKFGTLRTADSSILHKVVCLHKVVYTVMGKLAEYISPFSYSSMAIWQSWQQKSQHSVL